LAQCSDLRAGLSYLPGNGGGLNDPDSFEWQRSLEPLLETRIQFRRLRCYIMAIADAMSGDNSVLGLRACMSVEVAGSQIREIVVGALHREEASRNLAARGIVAKALAQAFPCAQ
jgi:Rap1a immunity proteins